MTRRAHHVVLARGWAFWRWVFVRGAGFPATDVLALAAPETAASADRLIESEDAVAARKQVAVARLETEMSGLRGKARSQMLRALKKVKGDRPTEPMAALGDAASAVESLRRAEQELDDERERARRAYDADQRRVSTEIRTVVNDRRFCEALMWQNRAAARRIIESLRRHPPDDTTARVRRHELMVASYVQRYCTKNDTIGFFGPIGWGTMVDRDSEAGVTPGPDLLADRSVYFEHWAVDALAEAYSRDRSLLEQLPPRRMPNIYMDGSALIRGGRLPVTLPEEVAALLRSCDGVRRAYEIANTLVEDPDSEFDDPEEVYDLLEEMAETGLTASSAWLLWSLEVPALVPHPEKRVREQLVAAGAAGQQAIAEFDALEAERRAVHASAGSPDSLDGRLEALESTFHQITGRDSTRKAGQAYAGRTLVVEDCVRDLDLRLGPELLNRIARPLSLVLQSARWYTYAIASQFRERVDEIYDEMRSGLGKPALEYARFFEGIAPVLPTGDADGGIVDQITQQLHSKWASILRVDSSESRVVRRSDDVEAEVDSLFAAPHPGWAGANCHAPDLLIAGSSFEEASRSGPIVLGELHAATNMASSMAMALHECPFAQDLIEAYERDIPGPGVALMIPKSRVSRVTSWSPSPRDFDVEIGTTASPRPKDRVLTVGELVVERSEGRVWVRPRDRRQRFDIVAFFEYQLMQSILARFHLLPPLDHHPRVMIDDLVVQREQWRIPGDCLPFAGIGRGLEQFTAARRWALFRGLPRWVFIKVPHESKPVFVDFDSPILVEVLAKLARKAEYLQVSEMFPALDQTWLPDARGRTYTCELRLVAVDPVSWPPPEVEGT